MRKAKFTISALGILMLLASAIVVAHGNERGQAKATVGKANVVIDYGRPSLKGRDLMKLIHPGNLWRIGADNPTTIESDADLDFGGTIVPKGRHILLARLSDPGTWSLVVSGKSVQAYEPSAKIAEVPMEVQTGQEPVEELTIKLTSDGGRGVLEIAWGTSRLVASFTAR